VSVDQFELTWPARVVGVATTGGGDGAAEPFGDVVPCVAVVASVGGGIVQAAISFNDEADQRRDGGAGAVDARPAPQSSEWPLPGNHDARNAAM
jgi:hypothetical protein